MILIESLNNLMKHQKNPFQNMKNKFKKLHIKKNQNQNEKFKMYNNMMGVQKPSKKFNLYNLPTKNKILFFIHKQNKSKVKPISNMRKNLKFKLLNWIH